MQSSAVITPLYAGAYAAAIQRFWIKEDDMTRNMWFGAASAAGLYLGQMFIHPMFKKLYIPSLSPALYNSKAVIERGADVGLSVATAYGIQQYVLGGLRYDDETMLHIYALIASHVAAVYTAEYMEGRRLAYLTSTDL